MKNFSRSILSLAVGVGVAFSGHSLHGQDIYSSGHGDIGVGYDAALQEFEPHWHLHGGAVVNGVPLLDDAEYEPGDLLARTSATRTSPTGLSVGIGVADGTTIFAAGSSTYQPNLGFGAEELDPVNWTGSITITLTGWTLPGGAQFALYTTNLAGTSVADLVFSTFAPGATALANSFTLTPGDHTHFQWGFTTPGIYELTMNWSGTHVVDGAISTTETFSVSVIPEPSSILLLGVAALGALLRHRRVLA